MLSSNRIEPIFTHLNELTSLLKKKFCNIREIDRCYITVTLTVDEDDETNCCYKYISATAILRFSLQYNAASIDMEYLRLKIRT